MSNWLPTHRRHLSIYRYGRNLHIFVKTSLHSAGICIFLRKYVLIWVRKVSHCTRIASKGGEVFFTAFWPAFCPHRVFFFILSALPAGTRRKLNFTSWWMFVRGHFKTKLGRDFCRLWLHIHNPNQEWLSLTPANFRHQNQKSPKKGH